MLLSSLQLRLNYCICPLLNDFKYTRLKLQTVNRKLSHIIKHNTKMQALIIQAAFTKHRDNAGRFYRPSQCTWPIVLVWLAEEPIHRVTQTRYPKKWRHKKQILCGVFSCLHVFINYVFLEVWFLWVRTNFGEADRGCTCSASLIT